MHACDAGVADDEHTIAERLHARPQRRQVDPCATHDELRAEP
jgi:hypothetical protein